MAVLSNNNSAVGLNMSSGDQFIFDFQDPAGANSSTAYSWITPGDDDIQAFGSGFTWTAPDGTPQSGTVTSMNFDFGDNGSTDMSVTGVNAPLVEITDGFSFITAVFGGNDTMEGTAFADTLKGAAGDDSINGGGGNDSIFGDNVGFTTYTGNDTINGGAGNDSIYGQNGNDVLNGNSGNNLVSGGNGNDTLTEGGSDTINGDGGNDRIIVTSNLITTGLDEFDGGSGSDILDLRQINYTSGTVEVDMLNERIEASNGSANYDVIRNFETIYGSDGSEVIRADNNGMYVWGGESGSDTVLGGGGNDTVFGSYGSDGDSLIGNGGNDSIRGYEGNDTMFGGSGNDRMHGGEGNDTIIGNSGNDSLRGAVGNDSIDGVSGTNQIEYIAAQVGTMGSDTVFGGSGGADQLFFNGAANYNMSTMQLNELEIMQFAGADGTFIASFNADEINDGFTSGVQVVGDTGASSTHLIALDMSADTSIDLSSWTFLNWGAGDEIDIDGDGSNETFTGSSQRDDISGGDGFNTYILDGAGSEADTIRGGAGTDRLLVRSDTDMSSTLVQFQSIDEIEFDGTVAGSRTLFINAQETDGSSEISSTLLIDGWNNATQDILHITMGAITTLDMTGWTFQQWGGENEFIHVVGDGSSETVQGSSSDDSLEGNGGNDTLNGFGGDDTIIGGSGADSLNGGTGVDLVDYSSSNGNFNVDMNTGNTSLAGEFAVNFENLIVGDGDNAIVGTSQANQIITNAGNDTLSGGGGNDILLSGNDSDSIDGGSGNDVLNGGGGLDFLEGGSGADTIQGGNGRDTAVYDSSAAGVLIDMGTNTFVGGDATGDILLGIEDIFGSLGDDTITGDGSSNLLLGDAGADILDGGAGNVRDVLLGGAQNDTLFSGEGADILNGGGGADAMVGGTGNDVLVGGRGNDTLRGDGGVDIFVFQEGAFDDDVISDWQDGADRVRIVSNYDSSDATLTQQGGDALFTLVPTGDTILFQNTNVSDLNLNSYDFIFI